MDTGKRMTCRVGWHHWHVVTEENMQVRVCADCGRRRHHRDLPGTRSPAATWGMSYTGGGGLGGDGS
ncbi:hypothetical protein [Knoellia sp. LjRoot47]|uniref:hypothetical protein n=1 Tax=Knoellia sp. LjRoot47 TaxID=3342330 RepID=UPI003ECF7B42